MRDGLRTDELLSDELELLWRSYKDVLIETGWKMCEAVKKRKQWTWDKIKKNSTDKVI